MEPRVKRQNIVKSCVWHLLEIRKSKNIIKDKVKNIEKICGPLKTENQEHKSPWWRRHHTNCSHGCAAHWLNLLGGGDIALTERPESHRFWMTRTRSPR